jgi:putative phosphoesterase
MIVGILSDTHGRADTAAIAVRVLLDHHAEYLVHCGDIGDESVLDVLAGHPAMFVFGNNDYDVAGLTHYAQTIGVACGQTCGKLAFGTKLAMVTHGDDDRLVQRLIKDQQIDYLFVGHTHRKLDQRQGRVRIINPGALYRTPLKTVARLDTATDQLLFLPIL